MPELPEVETVRRDLSLVLPGQVIESLEIRTPEMLVNTTPEALTKAVTGARIEELARRGKGLMLRLSSGYTLLVHFRMTGQLYTIPADIELSKHTRTVFYLSNGQILAHVDPRKLGTLEVIETENEDKSLTLQNIGPDAFNNPPSAKELFALLSRRKTAIKLFLLDQRKMSGIGNIYASEILFQAKIAPDTLCSELTRQNVIRLLEAMKEILAEAVECRGTTISDYKTGTGDTGNFQCALRVYGREGESCLQPGCKGIIVRTVQAQRSTFHCSKCQPRKKQRTCK